MTEVDKEREAIVAWLREKRDVHLDRAENGKRHKVASRHHADACHYAADAIERLAHHKGKDHAPEA